MRRISLVLLISCVTGATQGISVSRYSQRSMASSTPAAVEVLSENLEQVKLGFDFALRFQGLNQDNDGTLGVGADGEAGTEDDVELAQLKAGFTNATGNANLTLSVAPGVVSYVEAYLSSEHHLEMWMREGYLRIDNFEGTSFAFLNDYMEYLSFKIGQMEINYGDTHFRRTDNGEALRNPFIGNMIIDPNTTEIGIETMVDLSDFEFLLGLTGGTTKGDNNENHGFAVYSKIAYDTSLGESSVIRISGSGYSVDHSDNAAGRAGSTSYLYAGNRSGSAYAFLFGASADAGQINPNTSQKVTAYMANILYSIGSTELFLSYDTVTDKDADGDNSEAKPEESWSQYSIELKQSIGQDTYIAARHNEAEHMKAAGFDSDQLVTRSQLAVGRFLTKNALLKLEYVMQKYKNFEAAGSLLSGGRFSGIIAEGSVHF